VDRRTTNSGSAISVTYTRYEEDRDGVDVTYRNRKTAALERLRVMRVINCTVPRWIAAEFENSLLNNLLRQKLVRPDPLFLGLDTSEHGALVGAHGEPSDFLYTIGPSQKKPLGSHCGSRNPSGVLRKLGLRKRLVNSSKLDEQTGVPQVSACKFRLQP
jgi:hypothetical protein